MITGAGEASTRWNSNNLLWNGTEQKGSGLNNIYVERLIHTARSRPGNNKNIRTGRALDQERLISENT